MLSLTDPDARLPISLVPPTHTGTLLIPPLYSAPRGGSSIGLLCKVLASPFLGEASEASLKSPHAFTSCLSLHWKIWSCSHGRQGCKREGGLVSVLTRMYMLIARNSDQDLSHARRAHCCIPIPWCVSLTRPGSLGVPATVLTWSIPVAVHRMSEQWG